MTKGFLERIDGPTGLKIIIGSGFLWAWLDAMFMSRFFINLQPYDIMPEIGAILVFAFSIPACLVILMRRRSFGRVIANQRISIIWGIVGTLGSICFIAASILQSIPLLIVGGLLGGSFLGFIEVGWGAPYARNGARSATLYVSGGFAFAIIIDTPLLFMTSLPSAAFFSLLPLASALVFASLDEQNREFHGENTVASLPINPTSDADDGNPEIDLPNRFRDMFRHSGFRNYLGISAALLGAMMLVMVGFGYLQHLVSFSSSVSVGATNGIVIQAVRGIVAIALFITLALLRLKDSIVYTLGLLMMIAGFMLMPFMLGTDHFWVSGAIIIGGYTTFDLLMWVVFSQVAYRQSRSPMSTISIKVMAVSISYVIGACLALYLVGTGETAYAFISEKTTIMGYLIVIATVLILRSDDILMLFSNIYARNDNFSYERPDSEGFGLIQGANDDQSIETQLRLIFESYGLTAREAEIAEQLAYGRTLPWIAERFGISENTVGTHARHIYQKMDIHNRQQFIDLVLDCSASHETRDIKTQPHG